MTRSFVARIFFVIVMLFSFWLTFCGCTFLQHFQSWKNEVQGDKEVFKVDASANDVVFVLPPREDKAAE